MMRCMAENGISYRFIHTGQHRESMEEMYRDFDIKPPDLTLYSGRDILTVKQIIFWFTKLVIRSIHKKKKIFNQAAKCIVLVHGDTLSTLLGAFIGRFGGHKVGHIESGLRSYNFFHPFPEEMTRLLVFRLSHILFCPGSWALNNVRNMGKELVDTGLNTLVDTVEISLKKTRTSQAEISGLYGIVSLHRYENIFRKDQLNRIVNILLGMAQKHRLIFILHPPTERQLKIYSLYERLEQSENIECVNRYHHSDFLALLSSAEFVVTDGGSLQEETSHLGIPCLLLRDATERQDGLGESTVLSHYRDDVINAFVDNYKSYRRTMKRIGKSPSRIIVDYLKDYY